MSPSSGGDYVELGEAWVVGIHPFVADDLGDAEFFGNGTKGYLTEWILRAQSAEYSTLGGGEEEPH